MKTHEARQRLCAVGIRAATLLLTMAVLLRAQLPVGPSTHDSTLNNLQHAPGYRTSPPGTIPEIVRRGHGPVDVLLIPGWGFGARVFDKFMRANEARYRMVAVTLPGFAGTPAPRMPPDSTSYGDATWTRAAEDGILRVIDREGLRQPIVVGHFVLGTQLALRLALDHRTKIGGLVIVGGEPMRYVPSRRDSTGKTPMARAERVAAMDGFMAPRFFKTVRKQTFDLNNYAAMQYARDPARAAELFSESSAVPLPVMIRYLVEYMAMDLNDEFPRLSVPTHVLMPSFDSTILADPKQAYAKTFFRDAWDSVRVRNPRITLQVVSDSRIFITEDQPQAVVEAIDHVAMLSRREKGQRPVTPTRRPE
jgi:pimeloyl-ACP methyl ester carboxylesterase